MASTRTRPAASCAPNRILAKVSRVEVARKFLAPPPAKLLGELVRSGDITEAQARMAATIPMAQDLTVEADSGGHTDNRPAIALLPTMLALRSAAGRAWIWTTAAGGRRGRHLDAALGACRLRHGRRLCPDGVRRTRRREAGTSDAVRRMLAEAEQADVTMAPAADMFEMGVKLQVLKRGTMFAMRAPKLYNLYRQCNSLEGMPPANRASIRKSIFRAPLETI